MKHGPRVLIILDGYGYRQDSAFNAIKQAHPKTLSKLAELYPSTYLQASGSAVGLLPHMIGNSEVGHLTIGSGRVIKQPVTLFHESIKDGSFFQNQLLLKRFKELAASKKRLHLIGLLSDGSVHSHKDHLIALIALAAQCGIQSIIVHPFLDGRDVPPQSAERYLQELESALKPVGGMIGTMHGRFYAMDRDNNWDRTERSYKVLTSAQSVQYTDWRSALKDAYNKQITDEFFIPTTLNKSAYIQSGDGIVFFNFRADRARQLTRALVDPKFQEFTTHALGIEWMITFTRYADTLNTDVLYEKPLVTNTLLDVLAREQKTLFSIAETEKYAHITYFFNGGREVIHEHETRILIPSKRHFATYAYAPQMSAPEITQALLQSFTAPCDFYLVNYANADMVGHSGDYNATVQAIECLDQELDKIYTRVVEQLNGTLYITADHGKAEEMWDPIGQQPRTAHTTNLVPFFYVNKTTEKKQLALKELSDIAPFILEDMGIAVPLEMKK